MATKLTLRLDEALIRRAKAYAKRTGKSVSEMVADYFAAVQKPAVDRPGPTTLNVRRLKGALRGHPVRVEDYRRHLREKHR